LNEKEIEQRLEEEKAKREKQKPKTINAHPVIHLPIGEIQRWENVWGASIGG
jgi:hypothetical protein